MIFFLVVLSWGWSVFVVGVLMLMFGSVSSRMMSWLWGMLWRLHLGEWDGIGECGLFHGIGHVDDMRSICIGLWVS